MLDKNIDFKNIIMRIDANKVSAISKQTLPDGYSFRFFKQGDESHWARIEKSVLEFNSENEAKEYFINSYLPYRQDLRKRCLFVINPDGLPIATTNAWYANSELGYQASMHWVAVCPEYQGLGIGKAIVQQALCIFSELEQNKPVWLHTQTWSHLAVMLYNKIGFNMLKVDRIANNNTRNGIAKIYPNDFNEAIEVLSKVIRNENLQKLIDTAV